MTYVYSENLRGTQHIDGTGERERTVVCVQHSHEKNNCVVKELMNFIVLFYMYLLFEGCKLFLKRVQPVDTYVAVATGYLFFIVKWF